MTGSIARSCSVDLPLHTSVPGAALTAPALTETFREVPMSTDSTPSTTERKSISRRLRYEILRRDNFRCHYCGATPESEELHVDHVIPRSLGGTDDPTNLVTACSSCNGGKASTAPDQAHVGAVNQRAAAWAQAMQEAAKLQRAEQTLERDLVQLFYNLWVDIFGDDSALGWEWEPSIRTFAANSLTFDDLLYAVNATQSGPVWSGQRLFRYFCGVCWRMIRDRQERALAILEGGG